MCYLLDHLYYSFYTRKISDLKKVEGLEKKITIVDCVNCVYPLDASPEAILRSRAAVRRMHVIG